MQTALPSELLLMSQCSQKKANAIIESRPFDDWRDLVNKFKNTKYLDTDLLNAADVCNLFFYLIIKRYKFLLYIKQFFHISKQNCAINFIFYMYQRYCYLHGM